MMHPNPISLILWTFRRNERDIVNLYNELGDIMGLAAGTDSLNFGLWDRGHDTPALAQRNLCRYFGRLAGLKDGMTILDVGSGFGEPARIWDDEFGARVTCVNINRRQLARTGGSQYPVCGTAARLPFADGIADCILAFESAQHFRPLSAFLGCAHAILKPGGTIMLAMPVISEGVSSARLGIVSLTWSSEHYTERAVTDSIKECGFVTESSKSIGKDVYGPLCRYYEENHDRIKESILGRYPGYVEGILYRSLLKMRKLSEGGAIEYLVVRASRS